jgi:hypothetical protein
MYFIPGILIFLSICAIIIGRRTGNTQFRTLAGIFIICAAMIGLILLMALRQIAAL